MEGSVRDTEDAEFRLGEALGPLNLMASRLLDGPRPRVVYVLYGYRRSRLA